MVPGSLLHGCYMVGVLLTTPVWTARDRGTANFPDQFLVPTGMHSATPRRVVDRLAPRDRQRGRVRSPAQVNDGCRVRERLAGGALSL